MNSLEISRVHLESPLELTVNITQNCNLKCKHCYLSAGGFKSKSLEIPSIKKLINEIKDNIFFIYLAGGEPLLHPNFLEVVKLFKDAGIYTSVTTNGTLLTKELAYALRDFGVNHIQISVEGFKNETNDYIRGRGSLERILKGLRNSIDSGIPTVVATTLNTTNYAELVDLAKLVENMGGKYFHVGFNQPAGRGKDIQDKFDVFKDKEIVEKVMADVERISNETNIDVSLSGNRFLHFPMSTKTKEKIKNGLNYTDLCYINCEAGKTKCIIDGDGTVYPCELLISKKFAYGNINDTPFSEIWEKGFSHFRNRDFSNLIGCENCDLIYICQGSCPAIAYLKYGDFKHKDPRCNYDIPKSPLDRLQINIREDNSEEEPLLDLDFVQKIPLTRDNLKKRKERFGYLILTQNEKMKILEVNNQGMLVLFYSDGEHTVKEIAQTLKTYYPNESPNRILQDIIQLLKKGEQLGIISYKD